MGNGKRDFSEFNAKLEKHIERLPDYAQRAQEKLQKYFPPADEAGGKPPATPPQAPEAPRPTRPSQLRMPPMPKMPTMTTVAGQMAGQVPAVAAAQAKWSAWNHPAAKLERRKRRTSRALTLWILLTLLCGLYVFATASGFLSPTDTAAISQAVYGGAGVVVFGTLGVRSGLRLRQLKRTELPSAPAGPPPLPAAGSAARQPMERLAESEASLAELLRQLAVPTSLGTTAVPEVSVADARMTAGEAAAALRGLAGRIQAIERGRNSAPERDRSALDAAVRKLREQLDDGIDGYGSLLAAAGRAVAESSEGLGTSKQALTDATDHLAGLAMALRELS